MTPALERYPTNPLLTPTTNWWECQAVFNCGAANYKGQVYLLYRAVGQDGASRFGLAVSRDGVTIAERRTVPVFEPDPENHYEQCGCEDPRITPLEGVYYVTYTAASLYPTVAATVPTEAPWRTRVAMLRTTDFKTFERLGLVFQDEIDDKNAALFPEKIGGRYFMFHRRNLEIILAASPDLVHWEAQGAVLKPATSGWTNDRVGIGAPPVRTELGWLIIFHARDKQGVYRLGAFVVDLVDPRHIVAMLPEPLLEPHETYERDGLVSNVVFTCGMVERGGDYLVYYGGADRVVGGARISRDALLSALQRVARKG